MQADLAFALELADLADAISLPAFRAREFAVETKADLTPVTEVDRAVERALAERIAAERPDAGVLGEEFGSRGSSRARWILDPIDGTKNFTRGIPIYATLIALQRDGAVAVAVVSAPAVGRRWWAARGEGAFAHDRPIRVSTLDRLEHAAVSTAHERHAPVLAERVWHSRGFGDFWQHMLVAEGSLEAAVDPVMNVWDNAALQLLVEEAGGRFTDVRGRPGIDGGSAVSSNGLLHDGVLRALEGAVEQDA